MPEQSNTQKVLKGVSSQTLITVLTAVVEIVAFSIMSRLLTQEDFGYYAAVTAVSTIFASFADAGIGSAIVQRKNLDQKYIDNAFTLCLIFGIFGSSLLVLCSGQVAKYVADETMQVPLMLVAITLLTGTLSSVFFSIMHRKLQFLKMGIIRISALVVTTIVSIILALKGFGYYAIIAKVILYSVITLIVSFIAAHTKVHFSFDTKLCKEIFGFGGWLMASAFFRKIADQVDRLMMSSLFSVSTLGMYSRPKEFITSMTGKLTDIFDTSLFPTLSTIQDDNERIKYSYQTTLYYLNIIGLMITLAFMFNSELIIRIFLGVEWMNVNTLFIILSLSGILMIHGSLGDIFLRSLALTKQQFFLRILQAVASILLILLAAIWGGVHMVAVAYLLAYSMVVLVKMNYISGKIQFGIKNALMIVLQSAKVALYFIPVYILCMLFMPNTLTFNLIKLAIFILVSIIVFLAFPKCVGSKYKTEMHSKVSLFLNSKVIKNNKK